MNEAVKLDLEAEQAAVRQFFAAVDEGIGALEPHYPQLSEWSRETISWTAAEGGKSLGNLQLYYSHAMRPVGSFETHGCFIEIHPPFRTTSPAREDKTFRVHVGRYEIIATVVTDNPEVPELEQQLHDIIRAAATSAAPPPSMARQFFCQETSSDFPLELKEGVCQDRVTDY